MAFNLIRNARVFFTTKVDSYGVVQTGVGTAPDMAATDTFEIQVLDGLSFTQNTTTETVTLNEAGATPNRGQRNFNTALEPVDFTFSTYIRPRDIDSQASGAGSHQVSAEERHLWNAMFGYTALGAAGAAAVAGQAWADGADDAITTSYAAVTLANSARNQLLPFGLIICMDDATFVIDNCVMDTVTLDFGLDTIAMCQWAGKASAIRQFDKTTLVNGSTTVTASAASGSNTPFIGTATLKDTKAAYLANKLSTITLYKDISGATTGPYDIALTGGTVTIANNITYLTPSNLGVVNQPITYFTGTRSVTGSVNAYLRTGTLSATALYNALISASATDVNPAYNLKMSIGGSATAITRVDLIMPAVVLQIPTIATEQVVSTTIGFTAQGYTGTAFDIGSNNEIEIRYFVDNTGY
jgi:hypothetical protein